MLALLALAVPARIALFQSSLRPGVNAPAAVILGAGITGDEPSAVFAARLDYGLVLLRSGRVQQLILTGGVGAGERRSEADVGREYLVARGADSERLLLEQRSHNTLENLCNAAELARAQQLSPLIVVSDAAHLPRALLLGEDLGLQLIAAATPYSRLKRGFPALRFLLNESVWYTLRLLNRPARCPAPPS